MTAVLYWDSSSPKRLTNMTTLLYSTLLCRTCFWFSYSRGGSFLKAGRAINKYDNAIDRSPTRKLDACPPVSSWSGSSLQLQHAAIVYLYLPSSIHYFRRRLLLLLLIALKFTCLCVVVVVVVSSLPYFDDQSSRPSTIRNFLTHTGDRTFSSGLNA